MKYATQTEYWADPESGKLSYEFEQLYKDIADPWGCSEKFNSLSNRLFLELIFPPGRKYENILDLGCGQGYLTNLIKLRNLGGVVTGVDCSETAVNKAKNTFPQIPFLVFDIIKDYWKTDNKFELITMSEIIWYLAENIEPVLKKLRLMLSSEGVIAIHQYFPKNQKYGKTIQGKTGFLSLMEKHNFQIRQRITIHREDDEEVMLGMFQMV